MCFCAVCGHSRKISCRRILQTAPLSVFPWSTSRNLLGTSPTPGGFLFWPLWITLSNFRFPRSPGGLSKKHSAGPAIDRTGRVEDEFAAHSPAGQVQHAQRALKADSFIQQGLGQPRSNARSHRQVGADETGAAGKQNGGSRGNSGRGVQWISSIRSTARLAFRRISSGTSMTYRFWRSESRVSCRVI